MVQPRTTSLFARLHDPGTVREISFSSVDLVSTFWGNIIGTTENNFTYDTIGNLKSVTIPTGTVNYQYDGFGRRSVKLLGSTVLQRFIYRNNTQVAAVLNSAGSIAIRFIYGVNNTPEYMVMGSVNYRFVRDQTGSVRLVVNTADGTIAERIDYDEFGQVINDTSPGFQPFGFAGGLYDQDTKLVHFGARDYDPSVGRWISKDPILFGGGDTNLYGYVLNDPINYIDPKGLFDVNVGGRTVVINKNTGAAAAAGFVCGMVGSGGNPVVGAALGLAAGAVTGIAQGALGDIQGQLGSGSPPSNSTPVSPFQGPADPPQM